MDKYISQIEEEIRQSDSWKKYQLFRESAKRNRENFKKGLEDAMAEKINVIVVDSFFTFARTLDEAANYCKVLREKGVEIVFSDMEMGTFDKRFDLIVESILKSYHIELKRAQGNRIRAGKHLAKLKRAQAEEAKEEADRNVCSK